MDPKVIAKAIVGTAIAFLGALGTALTDGIIDPVEWTVIGVATLTAAGAVWGVPNEPQA